MALYCMYAGLLKVLLESDKLTEFLMNLPSNADSVASVVKKLLLSNKELLQLATAQCLSLLLQRGQPGVYAQALLHADMAGMLSLKVLVATIDTQWEGMGDVGSVRYEPALLPPCLTIRVLSYSN